MRLKEKRRPVFLKWVAQGRYSELDAHFVTLSSELFTRAKTLGCCAPFTHGPNGMFCLLFNLFASFERILKLVKHTCKLTGGSTTEVQYI